MQLLLASRLVPNWGGTAEGAGGCIAEPWVPVDSLSVFTQPDGGSVLGGRSEGLPVLSLVRPSLVDGSPEAFGYL